MQILISFLLFPKSATVSYFRLITIRRGWHITSIGFELNIEKKRKPRYRNCCLDKPRLEFSLCPNSLSNYFFHFQTFFRSRCLQTKNRTFSRSSRIDTTSLARSVGKRPTLHSKRRRRFRHGHAWNVGILWIELDVPRQRCFSCDLTFVYDYGLGLVRTSTEVFRKGIAERCHGRTISDVAREYGLPYTTVERWFYRYASVETEKHTTDVLIDEFATRKGHHYATIALDAESGRLLSIVPGRDVTAIETYISFYNHDRFQKRLNGLSPVEYRSQAA